MNWKVVTLKNLVLAKLVVIGFVASPFFILPHITSHGSEVKVPDVSGLDEYQASQLLQSHNLEGVVVDSVSNYQKRGGEVLSQTPGVGETVKPGRAILLTTVCKAEPMYTVPYLVDLSERQALSTLQALEIPVEEIVWVRGEFPVVLGVQVNDLPVSEGDQISRKQGLTLKIGRS